MIDLKISGHNFDMSDKVKAYVGKKIASLDKYLPRNMLATGGTVILTMDPSGREDNQFVCEAQIMVPGAVMQAKEATLNIFAAIDIVEAKLKAQFTKYKDKHSPRQNRRQVWLNKILRRAVDVDDSTTSL